MPKLLRSSETTGATIELDSGEAVHVSIAQDGVLVRCWSGGFFKTLMTGLFGRNLYSEASTDKNAKIARALSTMFPDQAAELQFKNPMLAAFANAIWHCGSVVKVRGILEDAAAGRAYSSE
jgi:hypothetical protein